MLSLSSYSISFSPFQLLFPESFLPKSLEMRALLIMQEKQSAANVGFSLSLFSSFSEHLKWLLFNNPVPSLIQEGPQCGLVALWMAGALLSLPRAVSFGRIVQVALERGYTAQGEMFSAADMAKLAGEVFPCQTELLSGKLEGENRERILRHLSAGFPVLIPYPWNLVTCLSRVVCTGALLGLKRGFQLPPCQEDKEIPGLFHASPSASSFPLDAVAETYLLSKQGKSCRYQLWSYTLLQESNAQLTDFSPKRAADGKVYIVPAGGVREGLCGKAVLLRPGGSEIHKPR
uniref:Actin maturation protease n=1 Tax=Anolis carolinensis TaxID=28377 RepID=A0A803SQ19_ANOCA